MAISERPVGAFLSGGLDSSTVVALLKRVQSHFPVFSIDWDEKAYSEGFYSAALCKQLGLRHEVVCCRPQFLVDHFEKIVALYDEPFGDESMIPTFCLAMRAKEEVDVVLTGDGADEFFHGYERYFFDQSPDRYTDVFSAIDRDTRELVCHQDFKNIMPIAGCSFNEEWGVGKVEELRARSLEDIQKYLPDDILTKLDRATMAVGLEARSPFLAPEITAFALNCSLDVLTRTSGGGKWIVKEAVKDLLPLEICERKKQGFGVPLGKWFSGELANWMKERLFSGVLLNTGWFSQEGFEHISQAPQRYSRAIYNLLVLESWLSQQLTNSSRQVTVASGKEI
jgi:asparagine synthase (glutamine-hydrolysing)